ncbi:MAG: hypothetical protein UY63_C0008G0009 [Parcubacteria group bacterium GW2011_GWA2_51_10]|nr:MAG: hypothetical protein UY63_C0008G0009 [Parcubacteria group bacterium GW2011_GWA2_51_10]
MIKLKMLQSFAILVLTLVAVLLGNWKVDTVNAGVSDRRNATSTPTTRPPVVIAQCEDDNSAPTIDRLFISPTVIHAGQLITFTALAHDKCGVGSVVYDIHYPASSYVLRPNCNFNGGKRDICSFTETIDHGISPALLGEYKIIVRIADIKGNVATYYPDGTLQGGSSNSHRLSIPSILVQ